MWGGGAGSQGSLIASFRLSRLPVTSSSSEGASFNVTQRARVTASSLSKTSLFWGGGAEGETGGR